MNSAATEKCTCCHWREEPAPWSNADCFIVVTGASRGFGRAFCSELLKTLTDSQNARCPAASSITFLLLARDNEALGQTKNMLTSSSSSKDSFTSVTVHLVGGNEFDLANSDEDVLRRAMMPISDAILRASHSRNPQWNLLVNNAGSIGDIRLRSDEHVSIESLDSYYRVNLLSQIILTNVFIGLVAPFGDVHAPTCVLSISSLAALKPFSHMMTYCIGKAARDMHLRCLSVDRPSIAAFVYAPGPLDTDMFTYLEENQGDVEMRTAFKDMRTNGKVIQPCESARMCMQWLRRQSFTSDGTVSFPARVCQLHQIGYTDLWRGQHLDYFEAKELEEAENSRAHS